jgi:DNA-binding beta-propeller fold protein YncE
LPDKHQIAIDATPTTSGRGAMRDPIREKIMIKHVGGTAILAGALATLGGSALAATVSLVATIEIPGNKLEQFDIGYVDSDAGRYYITDRSNAAVDIIDTRKLAYIGRVGGFVGLKRDANGRPAIQLSGPNGLAFDTEKHQLWAADGDSTVKVIDVAVDPPRVIAVINTGGGKRADELGVDSRDGLALIGNNAEKPTYVTFVSTKPGNAILAKIEMPDASDGIDQPLFVPQTGLFYGSVPIWKEDKRHGGLAVFDPKTLKMVKLIPIDDCQPLGLAQGPGTKVIVGCAAGANKTRTPGMDAVTVIIDVATEKVVKRIKEVGGQDEVWYNPTAHQYYTASRDAPGGPVLGVIDAETDTFIGSAPTGENAHSVAADSKTGMIFVPLTTPNPACANGCIGVYQVK